MAGRHSVEDSHVGDAEQQSVIGQVWAVGWPQLVERNELRPPRRGSAAAERVGGGNLMSVVFAIQILAERAYLKTGFDCADTRRAHVISVDAQVCCRTGKHMKGGAGVDGAWVETHILRCAHCRH